MSSGDVVRVVRTGIANLEAVCAAFRRLGRSVELIRDAEEIRDARFLVLPGVGSFASGMEALERDRWAEPIRERVFDGKPTLAICLGLQLLCESSDEAPGVPGLGCLPGRVVRFEGNVRVPQLGWNAVRTDAEARYMRSGVVYFANSYHLDVAPPGWAAATGHHGRTFVAGVERDGVLACQFHPELSGVAGHRLLARWLELAPEANAAAARPGAATTRPRASALGRGTAPC